MHYIYRATTRDLADALDRITEAGDAVLSCHHTGGRDWIVVCRKADAAESLSGRQPKLMQAARDLGPGLNQ